MLHKLLQTLRHPLQPSVLGAIAIYLLLSGIGRLAIGLGQLADLGGLPLILVGMFVWWLGIVGLTGFAFVVFRASANGRTRVPTITADDFRSLWSRRFMAFVAILAAAAFGWSNLAAVAGRPLIEIITAIILLLLPAALALMLLNDSLWQALSPPHQLRLIRDLGWPYGLLPLCLGAATGLVWLSVVRGWPWPWGALLWSYGVLLAVHLCGATLYRFHERVGLEPVNERLTQAALSLRQQRADQEQHLDRAFALARTDSTRALAALEPLFVGDDNTLAQRERVLSIVRGWPNPMVGLRLSQQVIARYLALGDESRAFEHTLRSLAQNPAFRPEGPDATLRIAAIAASNGRPKVQTALLGDFARRFTDHPQLEATALICARVAMEKTNERSLARQQLDILVTRGTLAHDPRVAQLKQALEGA